MTALARASHLLEVDKHRGHARGRAIGRVWVGISGYAYPEWRGGFYPTDLPQSRFLAHAVSRFDSIELNGTFYSLKSPASFHAWARAVPVPGFVYAVKGPRFVTHDKKLRDIEAPLANFFASGVLALGAATGPFLWQLPPGLGFHEDRLATFLERLPRTAHEAEALARKHDDHLTHGALVRAAARVPYRHAFEVRHPTFDVPAFRRLMARHGAAIVVADTAGRYPMLDDPLSDFVYVRLHGDTELYRSRYETKVLAAWADRVRAWAKAGRDVYVYFDNTALGQAPHDAARLSAMLEARGIERPRRLLRAG
ncbi:Hypothetical protein A7982_10631 [Minicystis rosea]|nr:Hypothetical protein A7982_10631 [Minicystis rosea]